MFSKVCRLFMYYKARDGFELARAFGSYQKDARSKEWDIRMCTSQDSIAEAAPSEWGSRMQEVFERA